MRVPSFKGKTQCGESLRPVEPIIPGEKRQIYQILHPAVERASRECIGVNLFCVLLLSRDHPHAWLLDACESKPVKALDSFERWDYDIANTGIQVKLGEDSPIHARFDGIACAAIRSRSQVQHWWPDHVLKPVIERYIGRNLQHVSYSTDYSAVFRRRNNALQRQVDIDRRSCCLETKFQRVTAFQRPRGPVVSEQPRKESVEGNLTSEAIDVDLFRPGQILQAFFQSRSECCRRRVCSR